MVLGSSSYGSPIEIVGKIWVQSPCVSCGCNFLHPKMAILRKWGYVLQWPFWGNGGMVANSANSSAFYTILTNIWHPWRSWDRLHMEVQLVLWEKFEPNLLVWNWARNMSGLLWGWNDCDCHCAFPYRNWKLYYTIIIIYVVVKHSGKISKNTVVGRIIWSRVNVFHEISRLRQ